MQKIAATQSGRKEHFASTKDFGGGGGRAARAASPALKTRPNNARNNSHSSRYFNLVQLQLGVFYVIDLERQRRETPAIASLGDGIYFT